MNLNELPRNDVARALAYVEQELDERQAIAPEDVRTLALLQDEDEAFWEQLDALLDTRKKAGKFVPPEDEE